MSLGFFTALGCGALGCGVWGQRHRSILLGKRGSPQTEHQVCRGQTASRSGLRASLGRLVRAPKSPIEPRLVIVWRLGVAKTKPGNKSGNKTVNFMPQPLFHRGSKASFN